MLNTLNDIEITDRNKILGEGAYSEVIRVQTKKDHQFYALKQIDISKLSSDDCVNLKNEMKLHRSLNHENIIKFYDALQQKNMVYFLLEYASNGCLFFYIHPEQGLPENLALRFLYQTALAVKYLHGRNLLHRDIKPENILLDRNFNVKLCDFGWSCYIEKDDFRSSICGTYEYMSPEILEQGKHSNKLDIWCLGIMLYEMLHGVTPFKAESIEEIKNELQNTQIMVKSTISQPTKILLKNLLKKNDVDRYNIEQLINYPSMQNRQQEFMGPISEQDFQILMQNYLLNVKSRKRNLPESIQQRLELGQSEPKINENVIKTIKESFFKEAESVQGFHTRGGNHEKNFFFESGSSDFFQTNAQNNRNVSYVPNPEVSFFDTLNFVGNEQNFKNNTQNFQQNQIYENQGMKQLREQQPQNIYSQFQRQQNVQQTNPQFINNQRIQEFQQNKVDPQKNQQNFQHQISQNIIQNQPYDFQKQNQFQDFSKQNSKQEFSKQNQNQDFSKQNQNQDFSKQNQHLEQPKQNQFQDQPKQNQFFDFIQQNKPHEFSSQSQPNTSRKTSQEQPQNQPNFNYQKIQFQRLPLVQKPQEFQKQPQYQIKQEQEIQTQRQLNFNQNPQTEERFSQNSIDFLQKNQQPPKIIQQNQISNQNPQQSTLKDSFYQTDPKEISFTQAYFQNQNKPEEQILNELSLQRESSSFYKYDDKRSISNEKLNPQKDIKIKKVYKSSQNINIQPIKKQSLNEQPKKFDSFLDYVQKQSLNEKPNPSTSFHQKSGTQQVQISKLFEQLKTVNTTKKEAYNNLNFVNANYNNIKRLSAQTTNQYQLYPIEETELELPLKQEENIQKQNEIKFVSQIKTISIDKSVPTHKFVLKNGKLEKAEITKEDVANHVETLKRNFSADLNKNNTRKFSLNPRDDRFTNSFYNTNDLDKKLKEFFNDYKQEKTLKKEDQNYYQIENTEKIQELKENIDLHKKFAPIKLLQKNEINENKEPSKTLFTDDNNDGRKITIIKRPFNQVIQINKNELKKLELFPFFLKNLKSLNFREFNWGKQIFFLKIVFERMSWFYNTKVRFFFNHIRNLFLNRQILMRIVLQDLRRNFFIQKFQFLNIKIEFLNIFVSPIN